MDKLELRQKLHHYIENADEKTLREIFVIAEDEIKQTYNHWEDEEFVAELQAREESWLNGDSKTYSVSQSASRVREALNKQNK